ncbi:MAG: 5'/3'-nucleotidase SurE [Aeromonas sp.]
MRVLVSNDDGVHAAGIHALAAALGALPCVGELTVVAPDRNCSAASNALTLALPLRVSQLTDSGFYAVNGTPTDSVHLAVNALLDPKPDVVVSGINHGANLGDDVIYSGTVAAAMEGRHLGLPAIAISLVGDTHFASAAHYAALLLERLAHVPLGAQQILNVNVPDLPLAQIKGIQVTRLGCRHPVDGVIRAQDPRGAPIYWVGPPGQAADGGEGTDFAAIAAGYVSITPLTVDLTAYNAQSALGAWLNA